MTSNPHSPSAADFSAALAAALGASLEGSAEGAWQATGPRPAPEPAPPTLHFALHFEGEHAGECFVTLPEQDAAGERGEAFRVALEAAGNAALARIGSHGVSIRARAAAELPADVQPVAALASTAGEPHSLDLFFNAELLSALPLAHRAVGAADPADPDAVLNSNLGLVMDVELKVMLRFGQRQMPLREVLNLASGSVVELDRQVDEPVELILEGRVIARGEAVIVDGNYGIRVTEVLQPIPA